MRTGPYFAAACFAIFFSVFLPGHVLLAQDQDKPAVAPLPRTINLTEEQRHIIKENDQPSLTLNASAALGEWEQAMRGRSLGLEQRHIPQISGSVRRLSSLVGG